MIHQMHTLQAECVVCHKLSETYVVRDPKELPPGWVRKSLWGPSWSSLLDRHYCSEGCRGKEDHGLKKREEVGVGDAVVPGDLEGRTGEIG